MFQITNRGIYYEIEEALTALTTQLRSATHADARMRPGQRTSSKASAIRLRQDSGWARQVADQLAGVLLGTIGIVATIDWHRQHFQKCTGIRCVLTASETGHTEPARDCTRTLLDVYLDAMNSIARRAGADRVDVALVITAVNAGLSIHDNAPLAPKEAANSRWDNIGEMQLRTRVLDGQCAMDSDSDRGTTITLDLPIGAAT